MAEGAQFIGDILTQNKFVVKLLPFLPNLSI
jgi:hypothetical protein